MPLSGANVIIISKEPFKGTSTDQNGKFRLETEAGRVSVKASFLGYEDIVFTDILVASVKEIDLIIEMREKVVNTNEVIVSSTRDKARALNQMASISAQTIRADDALRFAGGFYDPSRIVNSFAGVATSNSDESNDIIIRGNSSRGLLWRLEGVEIPNPNHFGDGQGGSGGAYSAITSNVISNFDFFTGAFPAEYGNVVSGVMDLNLRKGNPDKHEYAFQTGMIGVEASAEGPLRRNTGSSFLVNARYVNFGILSRLDLIDLGSTNFAPRSEDVVFNISLPGKVRGNFNAFGFYGSSELGKYAVRDKSKWATDNDRREEDQGQGSAVLGIKHLLPLPGGSGYLRSVLAYTNFKDTYREGYVDSSYIRTDSYHHSYSYPSLRFSLLLNTKLSTKDIVRTGMNLQYLGALMDQWRRSSSGLTQSLVEPSGCGLLFQYYFQLKNRLTENFEINSGLHILAFSVNGDISLEPRLGLRWQVFPGKFIIAGAGLHSRIESFPVYYNRIKNSSGKTELLNKDLGFSKSLQFVTGFDFIIARDVRLRTETYYQRLYDVPVIDKVNSTYSSINTSEELPSSDLTNKGLGFNRGVELTLEKLFSKNYYIMLTLSLFESKYRPGDHNWYNTYYNNSFVSNFLAGKDFYLGRNKRNILSLNTKSLLRGGYRYTPVDLEKSIISKKPVYNTSKTYDSRLPCFLRIDAGVSFRHNSSGFSWILMLDVQNITNRKNVFRRRFSYLNGGIVTENVYSLGSVPVFNFRIEF